MKRLIFLISSRPWISLGAAVLCAGMLGLAIAASGVVPVKASSGHWAITEWVLQFGKRRSVATWSRLTAPSPPIELDDPELVLRGAGHFETGCRFCHGSPGAEVPPVPLAMTPNPPPLSSRVPSWNARELFHIVKHGIKFTGMPAWPSPSRDDEVWAVVAFLRRLPSLDAAAYAQLVFGRGELPLDMAPTRPGDDVPAGEDPARPPTAPEAVREACARCHGLDGFGRDGAFPVLAGQHLDYMVRALDAYATGRRHSGIMEPVAARLTAESRQAAAEYYAGLDPTARADEVSSADVDRGRQIAAHGIGERDIPSCADCHEQDPGFVNRLYPRLRGQSEAYLVRQLELMQARRRGGADTVTLMHSFVDRLSPDDVADLAGYFGTATARD